MTDNVEVRKALCEQTRALKFDRLQPHDVDFDKINEMRKKYITLESMKKLFEFQQKNASENEFNEFVDAYWSGLEGTGI